MWAFVTINLRAGVTMSAVGELECDFAPVMFESEMKAAVEISWPILEETKLEKDQYQLIALSLNHNP